MIGGIAMNLTIIPGFLSDFDDDKKISALKAFLLVNC